MEDLKEKLTVRTSWGLQECDNDTWRLITRTSSNTMTLGPPAFFFKSLHYLWNLFEKIWFGDVQLWCSSTAPKHSWTESPSMGSDPQLKRFRQLGTNAVLSSNIHRARRPSDIIVLMQIWIESFGVGSAFVSEILQSDEFVRVQLWFQTPLPHLSCRSTFHVCKVFGFCCCGGGGCCCCYCSCCCGCTFSSLLFALVV